MCTPHIKESRRPEDALELEFQAVVVPMWGAGKGPGPLQQKSDL